MPYSDYYDYFSSFPSRRMGKASDYFMSRSDGYGHEAKGCGCGDSGTDLTPLLLAGLLAFLFFNNNNNNNNNNGFKRRRSLERSFSVTEIVLKGKNIFVQLGD